MNFDELELLYLRFIVVERAETLERRLERNARFFNVSDDVILYQRKIGNLEAELTAMKRIKEKLNFAIARQDILGQGK